MTGKISLPFHFGDTRATIDELRLSKGQEKKEVLQRAVSRYAVEKADESGAKRRYIYGIASGTKVDGHQERMTEKCIHGMQDQANRAELLLYPDIHGIRQSEDIGRLTKSWIDPEGDWHCEFRLYDQSDLDVGHIGQAKFEKADAIWRQINGFPPYKKPMQWGFSIEGDIPENGIVEAKKDQFGNLTNRVIDHVDLGGICLVPKPAYLDGIAHAAYKALGELTPYKANRIRKEIANEFTAVMAEQELATNYFTKKYELSEALERAIGRIMQKEGTNKRQELDLAFGEYQRVMVELILTSEPLFAGEFVVQGDEADGSNPYGAGSEEVADKSVLIRTIAATVDKIYKNANRRMQNG